MAEASSFLTLTWDLHDLIFSYLTPQDLCRLGGVCQYWRSSVTQCNQLWKRHCRKVWFQHELPSDCDSWYQSWLRMAREYGRYINCYADVKRAWCRIEEFLLAHKIVINVELTEKRTEDEITKAEQELGLTFPDDLRLSMRFHDGLSSFLGVLEFYYFQSILTLHSLSDLVELHRSATEESFYCPSHGNTQYLQIVSGWPNKNTAAGLLLALHECKETPPGHVIWMSTVGWTEEPLFNDQTINHSGVLKNCSVGLIGKSMLFKDWLLDCAQKLPCYPIMPDKRQAFIMRFYRDPSEVATTGHFTIRVGTALDPSMGTMYQTNTSDSIPILPLPIIPLLTTGGSYAYWIEIKMHDDAPKDERCQLVSRRWVIRYASGEVESVDGPGVIGETPVFTPGHIHQYASCTRFINEDYCTMEGHYTMRYLNKDGMFDVQVPRFHMPKPDIKWL
ncbi:F-box only protein 3-like [Halichondria panicea]|uniref:F-box only protein 3-like n=1 Tax=Halichondria panicea TaxID=6063 RepID=UPI00312B770A